MNKIYKVSKIYLVRLAVVTKVEPSGMFTNGKTYSRNLPEVYFAKLIKEENKLIRKNSTFKLLTKNFVVTDDHNNTSVGDYYVVDKKPLSMMLEENAVFVDHKQLEATEKYLNEQNKASAKPEQEKTKDGK